MSGLVFIGDEVSAAGWRLAGVRTIVPRSGEVETQVKRALTGTELLLITAELAATLSAPLRHQALLRTTPLVLIVPDLRNRAPVPDLASIMRAQLGLAP